MGQNPPLARGLHPVRWEGAAAGQPCSSGKAGPVGLADQLRQRRTAIVSRWSDQVLSSYHASGAAFFRDEADPFHNPVGATIKKAVDDLFGQLAGISDDRAATGALDAILRIRSVQELTASQATGFVFALKDLVRTELPAPLSPDLAAELMAFHARVDALALRAFDTFMACREQVWEIRARQASARVHTLLKKAGMLADEGDDPPSGGAGPKGGCQA